MSVAICGSLFGGMLPSHFWPIAETGSGNSVVRCSEYQPDVMFLKRA